MGNRYEQFYGYTGLFPIREDSRAASHVEALRSELAALPFGVGSMFSRTGLVHAARMFVIEDVIDNGHPTREEHLPYPYLAMSLTFDGDLAELAKRIAARCLPDFDQIFSHCYGYPRVDPSDVFGYLVACQVETTYLYVDVGDAGLERVLKALVAQRLIANLIVAQMPTLAVSPPGGFQDNRAHPDALS
jgi:hypothetical protein